MTQNERRLGIELLAAIRSSNCDRLERTEVLIGVLASVIVAYVPDTALACAQDAGDTLIEQVALLARADRLNREQTIVLAPAGKLVN
jgi:hypothetical protein